MRKKILILSQYYVPGIKGGGPIQSIKNLVDNLSKYFDFYIITTNGDLGDKKPYKDILSESWQQVDSAQVYYISSKDLNLLKVRRIIKDLKPDLIYTNSFFNFLFSINIVLLKKMGLIKEKVIIAPRGEFSKGALSIKNVKKKIFLILSKVFKFYDEIEWHATNADEAHRIKTFFPTANVNIANNLTKNYSKIEYTKYCEKKVNELKLVTIARIHPMKNLKQILEVLSEIKDGKVIFNIYGPIEDYNYWNECKIIIRNLAPNINVNYNGILLNEIVLNKLYENHVFISLTKGENFGHSISEALVGGCPVIISDLTPWKNLEKYDAGIDLSIQDNSKIVKAIQTYLKMDDEAYHKRSLDAFNFAKNISNTEEKDSYIKMFNYSN